MDGVGTPRRWVQRAKEKGLYGLALTDHGDTSCLMEFYTAGKEEKFPIVLGCEFYIVPELGKDKPTKRYYHITVLVKNFEGYKNLCKLSTVSFQKDHFYFRPRITFDELFEHKEGLIVLSGCLKGPISDEVVNGNLDTADAHFKLFLEQFKDNFYIELQPSIVYPDVKVKKEDSIALDPTINLQETANKFLIEKARQYGLPMVITPDAHFLDANLKVVQDVKLHARSGGNWDFDQCHHLLTAEEMRIKITNSHGYLTELLPELMTNTRALVDACQFDLPKFEPLLPEVYIHDHPLYSPGDTQLDIVLKVLQQNGRINFDDPKHVAQLKYEFETLFYNGKANFLPYFLLLEDVVRWCKNNNIVVGPGRGSASGSLLSYGLGITHLDPFKYKLSFDRFINKGRILKGTFPDVDIDLSDANPVKRYVVERYGADKVAIVGTFQTLKTKSAIKDVLSILRPALSFMDKNNLTAPLPDSLQGVDELQSFHDNMERFPNLGKYMENNTDVYQAVIHSLGQSRQHARHPCALVVSSKPLVDVLPLWQDSGDFITQYSADSCKKVGVVKYDLLGLNTLNDIAKCVELVKRHCNLELDPYNLVLDDVKTWHAFSKGDTETIFQFHTSLARSLLRQMKVSSIDDLAIITSLGRPGPMDIGMDQIYLDRRNGLKQIEYPHWSLKELLSETYGVMVYQEQVMSAVQILGGFSQEEADDVRRCMGAKDKEQLNSFKKQFIKHALTKYPDIGTHEHAVELWSQIESFGRYGFNRSHACAYGSIAYICQYLRQNYPLEWYCAVFSNGDKTDQKNLYPIIKESLVLPDVNLSQQDFYIKDGKIVMSLGFIHGMGEQSIREVSRNQPYSSFKDFIERVNKRIVRKDIITNLIFAGVFDSIELNSTPQGLIEQLYTLTKKPIPKELMNLTQLDLVTRKLHALPIQDLQYQELFKDFVDGEVNSFSYVLEKAPERKYVSIVGRVEKLIEKLTKKEEQMASLHLVNESSQLRVILWPETYARLKDESTLKEGAIVQVWGKVNMWKDTVSVVLEQLKIFSV